MFVTRFVGAALVAIALTGTAAAQMPTTRVQLDTTGTSGIKKKAAPAVKLQTQDSCQLVVDTPDDVKDAASQFAFAQMQSANPAKAKEYLGKAVAKVTYKSDRYSKNPLGQEFVLGQSLVMWTKVPGTMPVMKKGDLGFSTDKDQTIDLLHAADSLFTSVEKALPKCQGETDDWRRQAWGPFIVKVGPLINSGNIDSASKLLDQSMIIYRGSPFSYYFKGQIEYRRDQFAQASASFEQAVTLAIPVLASNPDMPGIAEYSSFFAGYSSEKAAMVATGADQAAAYKRAATLLAKNLKDYPCGRFSENAETSLFSALSATNDTAGMRTQLTAMTTETKPCSDMWWYNAAREASEMDAMPLAVQLADKAVAYSPWSAGLGNAAGVYLKAKEFLKLLPVAARLTQIAPNSQDDWDLLALGYQGAAAAATVPATKQAYKDSLLVAYNAGQKNTVHVRISEFSMDGAKRLAGGYVELVDNNPANQPAKPAKKGAAKGAKPAPAPAASSMAPKQVTIKMDFLDQAGAVVTSQSTAVTAKVGEQTQFSMTAEGEKIVGYRYAPIP